MILNSLDILTAVGIKEKKSCFIINTIMKYRHILEVRINMWDIGNIIMKYCERRYFHVVHIFAQFVFLTYLRKYVHLENYFYSSLKSQLYLKREF